MRTKEQIEQEILNYVRKEEVASIWDMGIALSVSPRYMEKILEDMCERGLLGELKKDE